MSKALFFFNACYVANGFPPDNQVCEWSSTHCIMDEMQSLDSVNSPPSPLLPLSELPPPPPPTNTYLPLSSHLGDDHFTVLYTLYNGSEAKSGLDQQISLPTPLLPYPSLNFHPFPLRQQTLTFQFDHIWVMTTLPSCTHLMMDQTHSLDSANVLSNPSPPSP